MTRCDVYMSKSFDHDVSASCFISVVTSNPFGFVIRTVMFVRSGALSRLLRFLSFSEATVWIWNWKRPPEINSNPTATGIRWPARGKDTGTQLSEEECESEKSKS